MSPLVPHVHLHRRAVKVARVLTVSFMLAALCVAFFSDASMRRVALAQEQELDLSALDEVEPSPSKPNAPTPSSSQEVEPQPSAPRAADERARFLDLLLASGWIGLVLLAASILAVSLVLRLCLALRRSRFIPEPLAQELRARLVRRDVEGALKLAEKSDSFLGAVAVQGLKEAPRGWSAIEKALEDAATDSASKTFRRSELLATIGNVAPMLGLLGTVIGMVTTFGEIAVSDGSGRNLANGIYFALVTTVDGLIVAIPSLVAHSLINARIAALVSEGVEMLTRIFEPLKMPTQFVVEANAPDSKPPSAPGLREISSDRQSSRSDRLRARPALTLPTKRNDSE